MAEAVPGSNDLTECPVCTDQYKDPRLLSCGHHFCLVCLQKIAEDSDVIICPTCRYQTEKPAESLMTYNSNDFQVNAEVFSSKDEFTEKLCSTCQFCMGNLSCMDCKMIFCDGCKVDHKLIEDNRDHRLHTLSAYQFCKKHPDEFVVSVCKDCDSCGCCFRCMKDHREHDLSDIKTVAIVNRCEAMTRVENLEPIEKDKRFLKEVKEKRDVLESLLIELQLPALSIRSHLSKVIKTLNCVQQDTEDTVKAEIKRLGLMVWDLEKFIDSKTRMAETLTDFQENLSDADVVFRMQDFPSYTSSSCLSLLETGRVQIPDISKLKEAEKQAKQLLEIIGVTKSSIVLKGMPLGKLKQAGYVFSVFYHSPPKTKLLGMIFNSVSKQLVLRTNSRCSTLKYINSKGEKVGYLAPKNMDKSKDVMNGNGLAYDSERSLYLLPQAGWKILLLSENNNDDSYIQSSSYVSMALADIAVSVDQNCYYVTESSKDNIFVFDPLKKYKDKHFFGKNCKGGPCVVTCTKDRITGQQVVIVGFRYTSDIKVYNIIGDLLQSYDLSLAIKESTVKPSCTALCVDLEGRIIVCDGWNKQIVSIWTEDGKARSKVLIDKEELGVEHPRYIAMDYENRFLYVGCGDGTVYKYLERQ